MAILGAKNAAGATAGVSTPDTLTPIPELAGISLSSALMSPSSENGHTNGHKKTNKQDPGHTSATYIPFTPKVVCKSPPSDKFPELSPKNILYLRNEESKIGE